ncbi:pectinesterase inhibitor 6-like [Impatiens glandulifera]|uniref:pectinesterase inhibitor 6-like n=1 Tax=Impatiens glandulifera TaxID=253017 RepID=UPI001FB101E7|nr:pectinesterase inhibitor 6-like [Impatiens glandulifera]
MKTIHVLLLLWLASPTMGQTESYVQEACRVTRYRELCVHSLSSFSRTAKKNPSVWARAGVSVTIGEAKSVIRYLSGLKRYSLVKGKRNQAALSDCIETFQDALDSLHMSLGVLRELNAESFFSQVEDVTTWLSSALTDEDTCTDGFNENEYPLLGSKKRRGNIIGNLRRKVVNASCITSNALALVNRLETTGPGSLNL